MSFPPNVSLLRIFWDLELLSDLVSSHSIWVILFSRRHHKLLYDQDCSYSRKIKESKDTSEKKNILRLSTIQDSRGPSQALAAEPGALPGSPHLLADGTREAVGVVGLAQGSHHLSFHELPTAMAACPIHPLVVQGAEVLPVLYEEATLGQVTATHCGKTSSHPVILSVQLLGQLPSACRSLTLWSQWFGLRGGDWYKELFIVGLWSPSCLPPL